MGLFTAAVSVLNQLYVGRFCFFLPYSWGSDVAHVMPSYLLYPNGINPVWTLATSVYLVLLSLFRDHQERDCEPWYLQQTAFQVVFELRQMEACCACTSLDFSSVGLLTIDDSHESYSQYRSWFRMTAEWSKQNMELCVCMCLYMCIKCHWLYSFLCPEFYSEISKEQTCNCFEDSFTALSSDFHIQETLVWGSFDKTWQWP